MPGESSSSIGAFLRSLPARAAADWKFKAAMTALVGASFTILYLLTGHFPFLPIHAVSLSFLDRAIGYHPYVWVWPYQSLYILINVIPWLADRREDLDRYLRGLVVLCLICFVIYIVYPIPAPRPMSPPASGMYWVLLQYDAPFNSLPSLHAGLL